MPTKYIKPCLDYWDESIKGDDVNIARWANDNGIDILTTLPNIVQHIGYESVFDPSRSLGGSAHYSQDPHRHNWGNPYVTAYTNIDR